MKIIAHIKDGQPTALSPKIKVLIIIKRTSIKETAHKTKPKIDAIAKGKVEKPIIPSKA